jgi:hypothetical protein
VFSFPNFSDDFSDKDGITNKSLNDNFEIQIRDFKNQVESSLDS